MTNNPMEWLQKWHQKSLEAIQLKADSERAAVDAQFAEAMFKALQYGSGAKFDAKAGSASSSSSAPAGEPGKIVCDDCGEEIKPTKRENGSTWTVSEKAEWSRKKYNGRVLCFKCSKKAGS